MNTTMKNFRFRASRSLSMFGAVLVAVSIFVPAGWVVRGETTNCTLCPDGESPLNVDTILEGVDHFLDTGNLPSTTLTCLEADSALRSGGAAGLSANSTIAGCDLLHMSSVPAVCGCPGVSSCTLCPDGGIPGRIEQIVDGFFDFIDDSANDGDGSSSVTCQDAAKALVSTVRSNQTCDLVHSSPFPVICDCPGIATCTVCPGGEKPPLLDSIVEGVGDVLAGGGGGGDGGGLSSDIISDILFGGGDGDGSSSPPADDSGDDNGASLTCSEAAESIGRLPSTSDSCTIIQESYIPLTCGCSGVESCSLCPDGEEPSLLDQIAEGLGDFLGGFGGGDDEDDAEGGGGGGLNPTCSQAVESLRLVQDGSDACNLIHDSSIPQLCGCPHDAAGEGGQGGSGADDDDDGDRCTLCPGGEDPSNPDTPIPPDVADALGLGGFLGNLVDCERGAELIGRLQLDSSTCIGIRSSSVVEVCGCTSDRLTSEPVVETPAPATTTDAADGSDPSDAPMPTPAPVTTTTTTTTTMPTTSADTTTTTATTSAPTNDTSGAQAKTKWKMTTTMIPILGTLPSATMTTTVLLLLLGSSHHDDGPIGWLHCT